jgi:glycosyltransferase involved in cell wall biosynthesis
MSIAATLIVFNEEKRIEDTLRCVQWCDEIVVVDRNSSDRTRDIARRYTEKVITIPNVDFKPADNQALIDNVTAEWIIRVTASDVIHPNLAKNIHALIAQPEFPYDVIWIPFRRLVLGMDGKNSPWNSELNSLVVRKRIIKINPSSVHGAVGYNSTRHFRMKPSTIDCMYHLTHETMDIMMDRHLLYCRAEAQYCESTVKTKTIFNDILRAIKDVVLKRTLLAGWDGIALAMAYISYYMLRYIYIWEKRYSKVPQTYAKIRETVVNAWDEQKTIVKI